MHRPTDTLRALYGLGGLADAKPPPTGGKTGFNFVLSPTMFDNASPETEALHALMADMVTADPSSADPTNPAQVQAQTQAVCACAMQKATGAFQLQQDVIAQLQAACLADPSSFLTSLDQQAAAAGASINAVSCATNPGNGGGGAGGGSWYTNPWVLGGGALLLGAAAWVALR